MELPGNSASARVRETAPLWSDREFVRTSARSQFADDFVREDRRSVVALPTADAETYLAGFDAWFEIEDGRPSMAIERVIAVRGERCVLFRLSIQYESGFGGGSHLLVSRYDDRVHQIERLVAFDIEDEDAALAELDRMHRDTAT